MHFHWQATFSLFNEKPMTQVFIGTRPFSCTLHDLFMCISVTLLPVVYTVNALHCDVWVVCARIVVCTVAYFIGFWEVFFGRSASLHDLSLHFLAKCFFMI